MVLIKLTIPEISCRRSPKRLIRFSVSEIVSRILKIPLTGGLHRIARRLGIVDGHDGKFIGILCFSGDIAMVLAEISMALPVAITCLRSSSATCATRRDCFAGHPPIHSPGRKYLYLPQGLAVSEVNRLIASEMVPVISADTGT